jgi:hypothetical protein
MKEVKPKPEVEIKFQVVYTPGLATKIFEQMSKMDLGITGGNYPASYIYSWTTTSKVNSAYIIKMRKAIRASLKLRGITQIHSIKRIE